MHQDPMLGRLIHENLLVVISHAFATPALVSIREGRFSGSWPALDKTIYQLSEAKADRALLELAVQLRVVDDREGLNDFLKEAGSPPLGSILQADKTNTDLYFRDATNKILHASKFEWALKNPEKPVVILHSQTPERWIHAELGILDLMSLIGTLQY